MKYKKLSRSAKQMGKEIEDAVEEFRQSAHKIIAMYFITVFALFAGLLIARVNRFVRSVQVFAAEITIAVFIIVLMQADKGRADAVRIGLARCPAVAVNGEPWISKTIYRLRTTKIVF